MTINTDPSGETTEEHVSPRSLAELARAGFAILRQPAMEVAYEVHHVRDRPGYLQDVLRGECGLFGASPQKPPLFIETLTTAAHGVGLVVGVRTTDTSSETAAGQGPAGHADILTAEGTSNKVRAFRATAVPNVSFVYDSARIFEGLMSVEVQHVPLELRHGRAIRAVMREVARIAAGVAKAPVLSMQSPVQLPPHDLSKPETDRTRPQTWSRSSAIAVRFALALPRATTALRLDVADAFAAFCRRTGVGLWLADSRSGYRTGNWFTICEHDTEKVLEAFDRSLNPKGVRRAHSCLPVTFVGPARRDAVSAILDYLDHYPELGVLGCSMATIDDIAFIHMQLAINALPGEELLPRVNAALDAMPLARAEPAALPEILSHLVTRAPREVDPNTKLRFAHRVGDHHLLVGPALPVTTDVDRGRGALWVSWEIDGSGAELRVPFLALQDALIDLGLLHPTNTPAWDRYVDASR